MKLSLIFVVLLACILTACGSQATQEIPPTPTNHPGQAIVSSRCIGCHELNRVTNAAYDREGWQLTVDRMVLSGAQLSGEQVLQVVDYLALTYPKQ